MNLTEALWVLDRTHTRDDAESGYAVETYPNTWESGAGEYIEAWGVVRASLRSATVAHLVTALEAALPDLHILDSRLQDETEAAGNKYYGLRSVRLVEAALEKVGER